MKVRAGRRAPRGALCPRSHPPASGAGTREGGGWNSGPSLAPGLGYCSILSASVCLKCVSGLGPDSTAWHGVGSHPAGSPTWPSPQVLRGLPGGHEALPSCLPSLGHEWEEGLALQRREFPASALPHRRPGQRHPEQLPRENHRGVGGWPVTVVRSSDQPGSHPTLQRRTGLTAGFLVSMDSRQAPNVSFV